MGSDSVAERHGAGRNHATLAVAVRGPRVPDEWRRGRRAWRRAPPELVDWTEDARANG